MSDTVNEIQVEILLADLRDGGPRRLCAKLMYPGAPLDQHMDDSYYHLNAFKDAMEGITASLERELRERLGLPTRGEEAEARYKEEMNRRRTENWEPRR